MASSLFFFLIKCEEKLETVFIFTFLLKDLYCINFKNYTAL